MTLGQLKEMIEDLERSEGEDVLEMDAYSEYDYGDHSHTRALTAFTDVQIVRTQESAYSDSGLAIDDDDEEDETKINVVALTAGRR